MANLWKKIKKYFISEDEIHSTNAEDVEDPPEKADNDQTDIQIYDLSKYREEEYYSPKEIEENHDLYKDETIPKALTIKKFQLGDIIGRGCFGQVYKGFDLETGKIMAIKKAPVLKFINRQQRDVRIESLEKEIELLSTLSHQNIVKYIGKYNDGKFLHIFLEYVPGGSINMLLKKYGKLTEILASIYMTHILQGLDYLHAHDVVHRDIKGANVLVDNNGVWKLADFGSSKKLIDSQSEHVESHWGTVNWMAPEVIKFKLQGRYSDIWSIGWTLIEMIQGAPPWSTVENSYAILYQMGHDPKPPPYPTNLTNEAVDFLNKCFEIIPHNRPNTKQLLKHAFITKAKQLIDTSDDNMNNNDMITNRSDSDIMRNSCISRNIGNDMSQKNLFKSNKSQSRNNHLRNLEGKSSSFLQLSHIIPNIDSDDEDHLDESTKLSKTQKVKINVHVHKGGMAQKDQECERLTMSKSRNTNLDMTRKTQFQASYNIGDLKNNFFLKSGKLLQW